MENAGSVAVLTTRASQPPPGRVRQPRLLISPGANLDSRKGSGESLPSLPDRAEAFKHLKDGLVCP